MSTQLNITSNLFGLSNVLGLEKQAASKMRLLRNSIRDSIPSARTLDSMRSVATAPRVRGAMSPTKMSQNIATNRRNLPGFAQFDNIPYHETPAATFINDAKAKNLRVRRHARNMLNDYRSRVMSGAVDPLDPATAARMRQLQIRKGMLDNSAGVIDDAWNRLNA